MNDKVSGNRFGSNTNNNHKGNKKIDTKTAAIRINLVNVPTVGVCRYSSACSKWSKYVVGKMITLGDVSTINTIYPDKIWCAATSGLSVKRTSGNGLHFLSIINSTNALSAITKLSISISSSNFSISSI